MTNKTLAPYEQRNREANRRYFAKMTEEERKAFYRERYHKYKGRYSAQSKKWSQDNREKSQASSHNTTIRKNYPEAYENSDFVTAELAAWLKLYRGTPCTYCKQPGHSIDHRIPLSKGGSHTWDNIQITCQICNTAKSNLSEEEFISWIKLVANAVGERSASDSC